MEIKQASKLRKGSRVKFAPSAASLALYSGPIPAAGTLGTVKPVSFGGGVSKVFLRGPGGGLVYTQWDSGEYCGVSAFDIERA